MDGTYGTYGNPPLETPQTVWDSEPRGFFSPPREWQQHLNRHLAFLSPGKKEREIRALNGRWMHKGLNIIVGSRLQHASGANSRLNMLAKDKISVMLHGKICEARLLGRELKWSDGEVWVRENAQTPFEGQWAPRNQMTATNSIIGNRLIMHTGMQTKIDRRSPTKISANRNGRSSIGKLIGDKVVWDDGIVWIRADSRRPLEGRWVSKGRNSPPKVIQGENMYRSDGQELLITVHEDFSVVVQYKGKTVCGKLRNEELKWDDGDVWIRFVSNVPFDGRWTRKGEEYQCEVIESGRLYRPNGQEFLIEHQFEDTFVMYQGSVQRTAQLVAGNRLVWDDGDTWMKDDGTLQELDTWGSYNESYVARPGMESVFRNLADKWYLTGLVSLLPLACAAVLLGLASSMTFSVCFLALVPLSWVIGSCTHDLAMHFNSGGGLLLCSTLLSMPEMMLCAAGIRDGQVGLVKHFLVGLVLTKLLLGTGIVLIFAGDLQAVHGFEEEMVRVQGSLLLLSVTCIALPTVHGFIMPGEYCMVDVSRGFAFLLLSMFVQYMMFLHSKETTVSVVSQEGAPGGFGLAPGHALAVLLLSSLLGFWCAEYLFTSVEGACWLFGKETVCGVGLPLLSVVAQFKAIIDAKGHKVDMSLTNAVGSALHTILLVTPFCILVGAAMGVDVSLNFRPFLALTLLLAALLGSQVLSDGSSNWLEGTALITAYGLVAMCYYFGG